MIIQNSDQATTPVRNVSDDVTKVVADITKQVASQQPLSSSPLSQQQVPSPQQLNSAVATINKAFQQLGSSLEFTVDSGSHTPVVRVTDSETGQLIRQIPSEETLAISQSIDQFLQMRGLLLRQKA